MGLLSRFLRRSGTESAVSVERPIECPHMALGPRWDSPTDMGDEDKATSYSCEACGEQFTPEEAQRLRAAEAARLKDMLERPG